MLGNPAGRRVRIRWFAPVLVLLAWGPVSSSSCAEEFPAAELEFFEKKIRPVLVEHCSECHGADADPIQGGLRTDSREALLHGGDSGPAVVPGKPDESLLIGAIRYGDLYQMPPSGKLPAEVVADFEQWVRRGAPAPAASVPAGADPTAAEQDGIDWDDARQHWAFRALDAGSPPPVENGWAKTPIDQFVLARLQEAGLRPSPPADKSTLLRRASLDLVGLPPTPEQVQAFLADDAPDAFAKIVDALLASPRYGERWGRHWLDLARYADTNGADENYAYHSAWRYRDYVIRALNEDKPYDRFVIEQIAGDLLPEAEHPQATSDQLTATGFLVLSPKMLAEQDKEKLVVDLVDEQIDTVGKTFLGLTLGCARCHDHKFDPVPTKDYYALAGIFLSTRTMEHLEHVSEWLERPVAGFGQRERYLELESQIVEKTKQRDRFFSEVADLTPEMKERKEQLEAEIERLEAERAAIPTVMAVEDREPRDVPVHIRGSHLNLASEPTPRGTLQILEHQLPSPEIPRSRSGRLQLARWITDPRNPLTARVMVNRIWQGHFGEGLVRTPSDFGFRGDPPTHPRLLDWLAQRFIDSGWSLKEMHRMVMLSSTYQMASDHREAAAVDPENKLLWRQNRKRLEVEPLRDALLAVSGDLDLTMGGNLEDTPSDSKYARTTEAPYDLPRRAVYLPVVRNRAYEMFAIFDYIDSGVHLEQRAATTVSHQALFMMNAPLVRQQAKALARQLLEIETVEERLERAYLLLFSRPIRPAERELARRYLDSIDRRELRLVASDTGADRSGDEPSPALSDAADAPAAPADAEASETRELRAWASLCRVWLGTNEFLFVN